MMRDMRSADYNYAVEACREHIRLFGEPPKEVKLDTQPVGRSFASIWENTYEI